MRTIVLVAAVLLVSSSAFAAVERVEITSRGPFADGAEFGAGAYEKIIGRLHYAVDPDDPANARITDLARAPRDADGLVRFAGDFMLLRPADPSRGNRRLLYEVGNRGNVIMVSFFDDAPRTNSPSRRADAGDGFLFDQGYALLWSAWNWDVLDGEGRMQIELPLALADDGAPIEGLVSAEITVKERSASEPVAWGNSRGYPAADPEQADARLTVRAHQRDARREIPRAAWAFARDVGGRPVPDPSHLWLDGGFEPGLLYEVVYRARGAVVVGVGLAAIRDALSFFRFDEGPGNPLAGEVDRAIAFGISQSGRVITHMLYEGFHRDEAGRMVFDAALIHVAGGGKGSFNHRFAQTTRHGSAHEDHQYPTDFFPFTTVPQTDPVTGVSGSLLDRAHAAGAVPKLFFTNTTGEYWTRAASLIHTDVTGTRDVPLDENARLYVFAGAQHGNWLVPHRMWFESCINPLDHSPAMRALLLALDAWVSGEPPPDSVYPRIDRGELGTVEEWRAAFPAIAGLRLPSVNLRPPRLDLGPRWESERIIDRVPPGFGPAFETRVALPDADGIARGGIRLPASAAPLGTYTGWNLRAPRYGAPDQIDRWVGSFVPFARTEGERDGDPRPSIAARYGSRAGYVAAVTDAAETLVEQRFLRAEDAPAVVARAAAFYDRLHARERASESCVYLVPGVSE